MAGIKHDLKSVAGDWGPPLGFQTKRGSKKPALVTTFFPKSRQIGPGFC